MATDLQNLVESTKLDSDEISDRTKEIHAAVLGQSEFIDEPNLTRIHPKDLELLFDQYDQHAFQGQIRKTPGNHR